MSKYMIFNLYNIFDICSPILLSAIGWQFMANAEPLRATVNNY